MKGGNIVKYISRITTYVLVATIICCHDRRYAADRIRCYRDVWRIRMASSIATAAGWVPSAISSAGLGSASSIASGWERTWASAASGWVDSTAGFSSFGLGGFNRFGLGFGGFGLGLRRLRAWSRWLRLAWLRLRRLRLASARLRRVRAWSRRAWLRWPRLRWPRLGGCRRRLWHLLNNAPSNRGVLFFIFQQKAYSLPSISCGSAWRSAQPSPRR